jgi:hypothetical protein
MATLVKIPPIDRLNVGAVLDPPDHEHPQRLPALPKYRCPACGSITAFTMQSGLRVHQDFDVLTPLTTDVTAVDGACRQCGRRFRVVADFDELHPTCFVYDVRYLIEPPLAG